MNIYPVNLLTSLAEPSWQVKKMLEKCPIQLSSTDRGGLWIDLGQMGWKETGEAWPGRYSP